MTEQDSDSYSTRRRRSAERRRLAVLKAAGRCFAAQGYAGATATAIALDAGVSKGLVFHYFGSKEALFRAVIEDSLSSWSALIEHRAAGAGTAAPEELRALFVASFDYASENPALRLFERDDEVMLQAYRNEVSRRNVRWRKRILGTVRRGMSDGSIDRGKDAVRVAAIFHELQGALLTGAMLKGSRSRHDRETILLAIDIFLAGIGSRAQKGH